MDAISSGGASPSVLYQLLSEQGDLESLGVPAPSSGIIMHIGDCSRALRYYW